MLEGAVKGQHALARLGQARATAARATARAVDQRVMEHLVQGADQLPGALVAHAHLPARGRDGSGAGNPFQQFGLSGADHLVCAKDDADAQAGALWVLIHGATFLSACAECKHHAMARREAKLAPPLRIVQIEALPQGCHAVMRPREWSKANEAPTRACRARSDRPGACARRDGAVMTPAARLAAAAQVLDQVLAGEAAEKALIGWARRSRFAGSGDRAALRDLVFDALRRKRSLAALGGAMTGRGLMLGLLRAEGRDPDTLLTGQGHAMPPLTPDERQAGRPPAPGPEASDMPDWLWPLLLDSLGDRAVEVATVLQSRAPVMLRVNLAKANPGQALAALAEDGIIAEPDPVSGTALKVGDGARKVAQSRAYLEGLVELQDGSSQATMDELSLPRDGKILDFCAGGGGKSLAMAARGGAQVMAHDIQPARMKDLPARAARAGVRIQTLETAALAQAAPFDLVLCDAPCSGSGAWRRAPEGKWDLTPQRLAELCAIQDGILNQAAGLVAPQGVLAYATCSVLRDENEARIAAFVSAHPDWRQIAVRRWDPGPSGDGFFLAQLRKG